MQNDKQTKEQELVLEKITMDYVNGHISKDQADEAKRALIEHWKELENGNSN